MLYYRNLKVFSTEKLNTSTTTDNSLSQSIKWYEDLNSFFIM